MSPKKREAAYIYLQSFGFGMMHSCQLIAIRELYLRGKYEREVA